MGGHQNPDDWLPEGWKVEVKVRKNGKKDKWYHSSSGDIKFNSKIEVIRYLKNNRPELERKDESRQKRNESEREEESMQKRPESAQSLKKVVFEKATPDGLPPGWTKEVKITKKAGRIRRDPYYTDPISGYVFRSMKDALRYIETGDLGRLALKPKDKEDSSMEVDDDKSLSPNISKRPKMEDEETCLAREEQSSKLDGGEKGEPNCESTSPGTAISDHASDKGGLGPELVMSDLPMAVSQSTWKIDSNKSKLSVAPTDSNKSDLSAAPTDSDNNELSVAPAGLARQSSSLNPPLDKGVSDLNGKSGSNKCELSEVPAVLSPQLSSLDPPVDKSASQTNDKSDSSKSELSVVSTALAPQLSSSDPPNDSGVNQPNGNSDSSQSKLSLVSTGPTPQSSKSGLLVDYSAKQSNGICESTDGNYSIVLAVEVLQGEQSPYCGLVFDETTSTGSKKSKNKKNLDVRRRVSKRLAGVPLDPTPELKTVNRALRTIVSQPTDEATGMGVDSSPHCTDAEPGKIDLLDRTNSCDNPLESHERPKSNAAASKELAKTGETLRNAYENYGSAAAPTANGQAAAENNAGRFETDNNIKGELEMPLDLPIGELWQDPCIAFAIRTLTGTSFDDVDDIRVPQDLNKSESKCLANPEKIVRKESAGDSCTSVQKSTGFLPLHDVTVPEQHGGDVGMVDKSDNKAGSLLGLPPIDAWSDPCIDFAIKTLTDAIPLDYSMVMQDFIPQQSSSLQLPENCGLNLPNVGEFCQTKYLCQQYGKPEKPSFNPPGFVEPALSHPNNTSSKYYNGSGRLHQAEERSKKSRR